MSDSTSRPRSRTKRRVVVGGSIVAGLIALGMWLSTLLPGLGLGLGGGSGIGVGDGKSKSDSAKTQKTETPPEKKPQPTDVVTVRIDGKRLLLKEIIDDRPVYRPATQAEVVQRAQQSKGNERGERVQIELLANAVLDLRDALKTALKDAGLKEQEMPEVRDFR